MVKKTWFVLLIVFMALGVSCGSNGSNDPVSDTSLAGVIITRGDGLKGAVTVYIDGARYTGKLNANDKWGVKLPNGRHSIKITYNKLSSRLYDFIIQDNRLNFVAKAFESDNPSVVAW